ncbi:hypothetical protein HOO54_01290 [Bacillus sp. WMMC1349]|uniref:hypothetical protein n=1 Tax=Bacillus sp. WMMC1349 TaxID=2736254 RepID=UPI0015520C95|nr:hypothetical protein [Bacillus sp. WMMC1349]NPC90831.1 hypothetical protein [Bacillus sp. WMMC1349]NPC90855.1 hypothetical protein [Bacillus sp. WMMC1349]NPC90887.1 hypothetical protein [Bacillus sp. WMMC1349]NPC90914.1 hypothetical protein [Bacillus sp. WMMC1349]NPC90939.1 hypothetical protein [Bacillus sp. WMMC1349]
MVSNFKTFKYIIIFMCTCLLFSTAVSLPMAKAESLSNEINAEAEQLENVFGPFAKLIDEMPTDVAERGIEAGVKWLNENKGSDFKDFNFIATEEGLKTIEINNNHTFKTQSFLSWPCLSSIGKALISNAIPWAKLLKVKKAAKLMGGINTMVKTVVRAYKHQRNLGRSRMGALKKAIRISTKAFPGETQKALLEFFNIGDVFYRCF